MSIKSIFSVLTITLGLFLSQSGFAHCQIPCGIYDDHARVKMMLEDARTIEKAMLMLSSLVKKEDIQSKQQWTRWVMNKEQHSQNIISSISDYFLTQRVKSDQKDYVERLKAHHAVIVSAMKTKQNADLSYVKALTKDIEALIKYYPAHAHEHKK